MLINFLHPHLQPSIECNTIASEGYEISNLTSTRKDLFEKGFLAERFISSPVLITTKFICPVTIKKIIIWAKVSNQKSCGFEISTLKCVTKPQSNSGEDNFNRLAAAVITNEANGVIFLKEGYNIEADNHSFEVGSFTQITFFRGKNHENISSLRLKIFKSRYVPAIKRIEIWGESLCDRKTRTRVLKLWSEVTQQNIARFENVQNLNESHTDVRFSDSCVTEIPEEFYDEITREIMTLPMVLPSGKLIDYSTLEKFQCEEEKWGRLPSDPFTGLLFNEKTKPVVFTTLKSKIDEFLFKNLDLNQVKTLPRRLGNDKNIRSHCETQLYTISKIIEKNRTKRKLDNENIETDVKRNKINSCDGINVIRNSNCANASIENIEADFKKDEISSCGRINAFRNDTEKDLEKLFEKTLSNLPSFLNDSSLGHKTVRSRCIKCSVSDQLYKLPCTHILCRLCIIQNQNYCTCCVKSFSFSEIQKIHLFNGNE